MTLLATIGQNIGNEMMDKINFAWEDFSELCAFSLKRLLESMHVYQTLNMEDMLCKADPNYKKYNWDYAKRWYINLDTQIGEAYVCPPQTISLVCANRCCHNQLHPHNIGLSVTEQLGRFSGNGSSWSPRVLNGGYIPYCRLENDKEITQVFSLQYQCQSCKGEPVTFLIRRQGLKFQIVGRSRIEPCILPEGFPKEERNIFSDAVCASQTGSILAAICLLRIAIEQLARRVANDRSGRELEEIFEKYKTSLPVEFPSHVKGTLKQVYDSLSTCVHSADANQQVFDNAMKELAKHFKMLSAFEFAGK